MRASDLVLPSLLGDALALGPHWIYDPDAIAAAYPGGIRDFDSPKSRYHPGKAAGELTHYGDQVVAMTESIASRPSGWSADDWARDWEAWARGTTAYIDGATRDTLAFLEGRGPASDSSDFGGAARIGPLFTLRESRSDGDLILLARETIAFTHGAPQTADAAEFLMRAVFAIVDGADFGEAFALAASHPYEALQLDEAVASGRKAAGEGRGGGLDLSCDLDGALPLTLALALRHENDPETGLSENAMLGGDSAARGLALGLMLGARHGLAGFPERWKDGLKCAHHVLELLAVSAPG